MFQGGQNVQKVATKVEVRFHVDSADWLSEQVKEKLSQQKKLTNDGYLVTTSGLFLEGLIFFHREGMISFKNTIF